jgi:murein L,D-transpeptidase YcbB/YkuD
MKVPFANREGIYLHDTPTREYFALGNRAKSNGCIRVENYRQLASFVLGRDVSAAASGAPEQQMPLPRGIPVYVTYLTMAPSASGQLASFTDVYGWDRPVILAGGMDVSASAAFSGGGAAN